jgi:dTMP kinase
VFVTFEGPEGSGKTTQIRLLADALRGRGLTVVVAHEPGATPVGEAIRKLVLGHDAERPVEARTEALLFAAARAQLVDDVIAPAIGRGDVVLCDRFSDSTLAYQVGGRGLPEDPVRQVLDFATAGIRPDLTVLLDLSVEDGALRKSGVRPDRIERETEEFHQRVRQAYLTIARLEPDRFVVIDARQSAESIASAILAKVIEKL